MRDTLSTTLMLLAITSAVVGCGGSEEESTKATKPSGTVETAATSDGAAPNDPIARVAFEFLDAVRSGDDETANSMLTPLAFETITKLELAVAPPGSATASFKIGAVDMVGEGKAIVESVWTDVDPDGIPQDEQIVWALRDVGGKWRISGMAAEVGPDQPDVVIDFENPGAQFRQQYPAETPAESAPTVQTAQDPFQDATSR